MVAGAVTPIRQKDDAMSHLKLLVVEDDDTCRDRICSLLRHMDFDVASAATVSEGLAALDPPPYCVLLDLSLPDGARETILAKIRADRISSRVAVCTGDDEEPRLKRVREMGATTVLMKPLGLSELVTACRVPPSLRPTRC